MTKGQLIERLKRFDDNTPIMTLDGFNGGGSPREINLGPRMRVVTPKDADEAADCEGMVGTEVIVIGYGCY